MIRTSPPLLLLIAALIAGLPGCSGETPSPGPASTPSQTEASAPADTAGQAAAAAMPDDDGIEATPAGNTEPPLADVTSAVADVPPADAGSADPPDGDPSAAGVSVRVVTPSGFAEVIAKHKGKVVFVDFWATWCVPCRKAFPHTVELARKHPDSLAVVSMSLDDADSRESVLQFLKEQNATFDNLMCAYGGAAESYEAYDIPGSALPYFRIYDRDGSLKHTFGYDADRDQGVDEAAVHQALEALLAADSPGTP